MSEQRKSGVILCAVFLAAGGCTSFRSHGAENADASTDAPTDMRRDMTNAMGGASATGGAGVGTGGDTGGGAGGISASGGSLGTGGLPATGGAPAAGGMGGGPVTCTGATHKCGDTCAANSSPDFCGLSCIKCVAPAGGTATCDGSSCDFTCGTMKKCATTSICVPTTGCCSNTDCAPMAGGQSGTCDSTTHQCNYSCPANMQSCTSGTSVTCIPMGGCCQNSDCTGACKTCSATHTCIAAMNMDDPNGRCAGTCDATGVCKSKRGQLCSTVSGGCVGGTTCAPDGYCCNTACTGACQACDVQGSVGTCTNVNSGAPHSNHPGCGTDPACQGTCAAGACSYPTKTCGAGPTCTGSNLVGQSMCGSGTCMTPAASACSGSFSCATGTTCGTTCSGTTGCASTSYCNNSACVAKKPAGQLCAAAIECTSNVCGGRCCNAGSSCSCPQPSATNLVTNPGFDQNTGGWQVTNTAGSTGARVASEDASKCPYSGALAITSASDSGAETTFSQCVNLGSNGATLNVGLQWKVLANSPGNAGIVCRATLTGDSNCAVTANDPGMTLIMSDEYPPLNAWSGYQPGSPNFGIRGTVANPGSFTHLLLSCQGRNGIAVDMAYVNTAAAAY